MSNDKETPKRCEATLCCRATAELQAQVEQEKQCADPQKVACASIDELINFIKSSPKTEETDENQND